MKHASYCLFVPLNKKIQCGFDIANKYKKMNTAATLPIGGLCILSALDATTGICVIAHTSNYLETCFIW